MILATGLRAEDVAVHYLTKRGFKIIKRNVRYAFGEIDIVALHQKTLVFVEVKYRRSLRYGSPTEAVGNAKQRKIILAAHAFLQTWPAPQPACRFDVVALAGNLQNPHIDHITDAFWDEREY